MTTPCNHVNTKRYTRRVFSNNSIHFCVQCTRCLKTVKEGHSGKLFLKQYDIPANAVIFDYIDPSRGSEF